MKDANIKAIEELTAINDIIDNILRFDDDEQDATHTIETASIKRAT